MAGRYFLGVEVPTDVCAAELTGLQQRLGDHLDVKRWYRPEQLHITVQFMGQLEAEQVERLIQLVALHTRDQVPFDLELGTVGWFPRAKVVWCGVRQDAQLQALERRVVGALAGVFALVSGTDVYRPHVTLGRLRTAQTPFRPEQVAAPPQGIAWSVNALHLFESVSTGATGPEYPIRHTFSFSSSHDK